MNVDIKKMQTDDLVDIAENIWGFEETVEALNELSGRDPQKALALGLNILENDKGDDYLQGSVLYTVIDIDPDKTLNALSVRKNQLGKILLRDIIEELNTKYYIKDFEQIPQELTAKIIDAYNASDHSVRNELSENYNEFIKNLNSSI